jgi:flagellar motor protein MotB
LFRKNVIIAAVFMVLLFAGHAFTAETTGTVGMGARGGMYLPGGEWNSRLFGGAEINFGIHKNFSIGLLGTYGRTKGAGLDLTSSTLPQLVSADDDLRITHYIAELVGNVYLSPENDWRPYFTAGIGIASWKVADCDGNRIEVPDINQNMFEFKDQQLSLVFGAGMEYFLIDRFSVGAAARYHLFTSAFSQFKDDKDVGGSDALDNPGGMFEFGLTMTAYFSSCDDDDKDGVCNEDDRCPETPFGCIIDEETGCELDADGDGVCDGIDQCPDTPRGCKVDAVGCPMDTDNDGVCDGIDRCENTPTDCKVDAYGCPLDTDGDGVWDCRDDCPNTSKGCVVDDKGCMVDSDGDGICDGLDKCPGTPAGLEVDAAGCPVAYKIERELILVGVTFAVNSANISGGSKTELDKAIESLKALPHVKLEVAGHSDISGSRDRNMELSQKRAESVRTYFIEQGIAPDRLTAKGYGPDQAKFDNNTAEGRKKNRRVELKRLN